MHDSEHADQQGAGAGAARASNAHYSWFESFRMRLGSKSGMLIGPQQPLHDVHHPWRGLRDAHFEHGWAGIKSTVEDNGHRWCSLCRDLWACDGATYGAVLRKTRVFNSSLNLRAFPRGTRIFAEGNSFLAQHINTILCNSDATVLLVNAYDKPQPNSLLAHEPMSNVTMLLLDNDYHWNNATKVARMLLRTQFAPHVIALGDLNGGSSIAHR